MSMANRIRVRSGRFGSTPGIQGSDGDHLLPVFRPAGATIGTIGTKAARVLARALARGGYGNQWVCAGAS
jgi:hypothetical protein